MRPEILGWLERAPCFHQWRRLLFGGVFATLPDVEGSRGVRLISVRVESVAKASGTLVAAFAFLRVGNKYIHRETTFVGKGFWERAVERWRTTYAAARWSSIFFCTSLFSGTRGWYSVGVA